MSRSCWKVPYFSRIFFSNLARKGKLTNIWDRRSNVSFLFVDKVVFVHNGMVLLFLDVKSSMLGYKFGEFSFTKTFNLKSLKAQKGLKKN